MTGIRWALIFASVERYFFLISNFIVIAAASRLLTPAEVGIAALGSAFLGVADSIREAGTTSYLVQERQLTREQIRTAFTVMLLLSAAMGGLLLLSAGAWASFYREAGIASYLEVVALAFVVDSFAAPALALLRRDMAFGTLATINMLGATVNAGVTIGLAALGCSYMSFAWGGLAWGASTALLAAWFRPGLWMYRPLLSGWRRAIAFGGCNTAIVVLNRLYEALPSLVLGRVLPPDSVGLFARATLLSRLPDRVLLFGVAPVALPALAADVRAGRELKQRYLGAMTFITAVQWPGLVMTALLAHPLVLLFLGSQWLGAVPLVQIMALSWMCFFPAILSYPTLVAVGAIRDLLLASLISLPVCTAILVAFLPFGLKAVALSFLITQPLQVYVTLTFIRRHLRFRWGELGAAVSKSAAVTVACAAGPAIILAASGRFDMPPGTALGYAVLAAAGWTAGLFLFQHPFAGELRTALAVLRRSAPYRRASEAVLPFLGQGKVRPSAE